MTSFVEPLLRPGLRGRTPYGAPQIDVPVRLNTNENSYRLPDDVTEAIAASLAAAVPDLNRYPDRDASVLRRELAAYVGHGLTTERVWAANGSNEILQQLLQAFAGPDRIALGFTPSYSMHPILAVATGTRWRDGLRAADFTVTPGHVRAAIEHHRPDVVFLCSPNNPTGTSLDNEVILSALDACEGLVVVDEAYSEFARVGTASAVELLDGHRRLVVTRTMSKAFGLAGARLGYLIADAAIVDAVQLVRLPYHLSSLTQAAAVAALKHRAALLANVDRIRCQRDRLVHELTKLGMTVAPSDANFVLFGGMADSTAMWRSLVDRGVLIRDVGIAGWLRVTAGTETETDAFLAALSDVLDERQNQ